MDYGKEKRNSNGMGKAKKAGTSKVTMTKKAIDHNPANRTVPMACDYKKKKM